MSLPWSTLKSRVTSLGTLTQTWWPEPPLSLWSSIELFPRMLDQTLPLPRVKCTSRLSIRLASNAWIRAYITSVVSRLSPHSYHRFTGYPCQEKNQRLLSVASLACCGEDLWTARCGALLKFWTTLQSSCHGRSGALDFLCSPDAYLVKPWKPCGTIADHTFEFNLSVRDDVGNVLQFEFCWHPFSVLMHLYSGKRKHARV